MVEQKFEAIVEKFEVFQEEFVQEFEDFIPAAEIQQFMEEAPAGAGRKSSKRT